MEGFDTFDIGYAAAKAEYIPELQAKYDAELQNLRAELSATKEKLALAEKRIRESQKQEPTVFVFPAIQDGYYNICNRGGAGQIPLYTILPIPPELAELQRENAELHKQIEAREGWQLVPIDPTEEMLEDAWSQSNFDSLSQLIGVYSAMLKAAPKP